MRLNNQYIVLQFNKPANQYITKNYRRYGFHSRAVNGFNEISYNSNYKQSLSECYSSYSVYKERAFAYCKEIENHIKASNKIKFLSSGISSYNCMQFSFIINILIDALKYEILITKDSQYIISSKNNINILLQKCNKEYYSDFIYESECDF